ncbi:MAG: tetratricopeptide repeat protein [bacterium]
MKNIKKHFFSAPWNLIRFFIPFTALVPFVVYSLTVFTHVYPGLSAFLTAFAADLCQSDDLSHPLFALASRVVATLPFATLPVRLNLFCAVCGALAVAGFYLFTARMIFVCACEDSGGALAALPPRTRELSDDTRDKDEASFAFNADGSVSIPLSVLAHNWRVAHAAVLGGLGAAVVLAFCAPFWMVSTRLYPFTFDLMLFFFIINLVISYDQRERLFSLYLGVFLLAACSVESALFLLLLPISSLLLLRSMILNEQATFYKVLFAFLVGLAGTLIAGVLLWKAAALCSAIPIPAPRIILRIFQATLFREILSWIPRFGWSYVFVQVLFPTAIALFVLAFSFRKRTAVFLLSQLVLTVCLIPSILNLRISPWGIARLTSKIPVFSYVIIALLVGFMIAIWHLMREMFQEKINEDLDYYEYRDSPFVCRIGSLLCWPLLLLVCVVPFRSFTDIDPRNGTFADAVAEEIYRELGPRDWLINSHLLQHHLMIRALQDGRRLRFLSTDDTSDSPDTTPLTAYIQEDPSFDLYRSRLLNAADLSPASFISEWLRHETNAYQRVVFFNAPELWRANGFTALPTGLFLSGQPKDTPVDSATLLTRHLAFVELLRPLLFPETPDTIHLFVDMRASLRSHLAFLANELGFLLTTQGHASEAAELFKQAEELFPDNLCVLLNRYHLASRLNIGKETLPELEASLRNVPKKINTFALSPVSLQAESGTLINPDGLEDVRKTFWTKSAAFRHLVITSQKVYSDPLTGLRNKKRELYQTIPQKIDACEFDDADRQLNLLLDLDDKDLFALINKARIAIERHDLPEAGLWLDLAKENGVKPADLIWHEAAMLILNNNLVAARAMLNAAIPVNPSDIHLWGLLADILLRLNEYPELENRVFPALRSASSKKEHYLMFMVRGYILKRNGPADYSAARDAFLHALKLNKNLTALREEVLRLDDALGVPAFCEQDAKAVLRQNPDHAFANFLLGTVRLHRGELDKAEDLFKRSLEKERNAPACAGLGGVLLAKKDFDSAEKLLRSSIELDRLRLSTWHTLAQLLLATDRLDEASRALDLVIAGLPENLDVRLTLIRLQIKQKKFEDAAALVSDLLENKNRLPRSIALQLKPLAAQLSAELSK